MFERLLWWFESWLGSQSLRGSGRLVERLAEWHLDHEVRHGSQVLAIARDPKEVFVLFRDHVCALKAEENRWLLPGRMLSREDQRVLFGPKGTDQEASRLEGPWSRIEVLPDDPPGARLRLERAGGPVRTWAFASIASAEELCTRLGGPIPANRQPPTPPAPRRGDAG